MSEAVERPVEVTVNMLSYCQERYIAQALDSVLMQETTFRYEILIGDDASTDSTPEIIRGYAERYPDIIRAVLRPKNLGAPRNSMELCKLARGKYFAPLEGDDRWLDPHKLQKQWEFLESHPEYSGCCGKCVVVDRDGTPDYAKHLTFYKNRKVTTLEDFLNSWCVPGHVSTWMHRNYGPGDPEANMAHPIVGDKTSMLQLLLHGPFYCANEVLSAYRYVRKGGGNYFSRHYANPYRNYEMFLYPCRLETWLEKKTGLRHYDGKRKEYRFCRFVEETVREPSARRLRCLAEMVASSHQPAKYLGLVCRALIEMEA